MKNKPMRLGFDVHLDQGALWRPVKIQFWNSKEQWQKLPPSAPFKYMADALVGLSLVKLNHHFHSPIAHPHLNYSLACEALQNLNPHLELYDRSQPRVRSLQAHLPMVDPPLLTEFENQFNECFDGAIKPWGMDLTALGPLLDTFNWLEHKMGRPLLYNFGLNFSKSFTEKLHGLYACLYHLRNLVAIDHNAHCEDPAHEGVKVDAITDYLPRAEYVVNDAVLYWHFKKLSQPFAGPHNQDGRVDKLFIEPLDKAFNRYSHNACCLIENLPSGFISSLSPLELEEALYLVQIDWLLGAPAGLLFKIREELFGLQNGYDKIFWSDIEAPPQSQPSTLSLSCEIYPESFLASDAA